MSGTCAPSFLASYTIADYSITSSIIRGGGALIEHRQETDSVLVPVPPYGQIRGAGVSTGEFALIVTQWKGP